ncbi:MAG TPA: ATP-dependent sacrificial sulfur transferase LarE [Candidatus Obscuribacterales bacterium]
MAFERTSCQTAISPGADHSNDLQRKEQELIEMLASLDDVLVAYSGGVDSSLLAYYARKVLGARAKVVIAVSPSLAQEELTDARKQADAFGWELVEIGTDEVAKAEYQQNDGQRCYFCKSTLFEAMKAMAAREGFTNLAYGANLSDMGDFRPGHRAAYEHRVLSPLKDAALTKEEIRKLAARAGLPSWDRPQSACLSSRFPTFEKVTPERLAKVEKAEERLHAMGFRQVRVRYHSIAGPLSERSNAPSRANDSSPEPKAQGNSPPSGDERCLARIELEQCELKRLIDNPHLASQIADELKQIGFTFVTIDLEGYRQGSGNVIPVEIRSHGQANGQT